MPLPSVERHSQKQFPNKSDRAAISERAYYNWLEAGAPYGSDGKEFWYAAEQELTKAEVTLEEVLEIEIA
jgi:Protein of unknown function (DUF2934)